MSDFVIHVGERDNINLKFKEINKKIDVGINNSYDAKNKYVGGNGIIVQNRMIFIDPELILDCGTSTTVLHGGVI